MNILDFFSKLELAFALPAFFTTRFYILCMFYVEIMNKSRWRCKPDWMQTSCFVLRDFNKNWFHVFFLFVLFFCCFFSICWEAYWSLPKVSNKGEQKLNILMFMILKSRHYLKVLIDKLEFWKPLSPCIRMDFFHCYVLKLILEIASF